MLVKRLGVRKKVSYFAGKSILSFLRKLKSAARYEIDPTNPLHKKAKDDHENAFEQYIEQFKKLREILEPDDVP